MWLTDKELNIIDQVMIIPMYASGIDELLNKTHLDSDYVYKLRKIVTDLINKRINIHEVSHLDYTNLVKVFFESIKIAKDFDDIHTLTGYTDIEINLLVEKLKVTC